MDNKEYPKIYLYKRIVHAKMYIDDHFAKTIDLKSISGEAAFSKFHFIRLFKKIYGVTPHLYLRNVRIEKAKKLLSEGISITEVCEQVGFESIGSFTTLFKNIVGETPSAHRAHQLNRKRETLARPIQFVPNCFVNANGWTRKAILKK